MWKLGLPLLHANAVWLSDGAYRAGVGAFSGGAPSHTCGVDTFVMLYGYSQMDQTRAILSVVDVGPLNKGLVTVSAEALARDITTEGHATRYGVYFDTDSATIKPESDSVVKEMAKLLSQDASLKVFIVGHTDNVGCPGTTSICRRRNARRLS